MTKAKKTSKQTGFSKTKTPTKEIKTEVKTNYIIQINEEVLIDKKYWVGEHQVSSTIYEWLKGSRVVEKGIVILK